MTNKKCEGIDCAWCMNVECPNEKERKMTDKEQIMINGVDVGECEYLTYQLEEDGQYYWFCNIAPVGGPDECEYRPECFYKKIFKQLARKTQECEELKNKIKKLRKNLALEIELTARYRKALEEVEGLVKNFCKDCDDYENCNWDKEGCYYSLIPNLKDIINNAKGEEDAQTN